ncbi:MAG: phosphoglycerate kinase [Candidatus Nanohaloarchaea archaeon]
MKSLEDVDVEGKNVLLRTDLNMPIEDGEPQETVRFQRYLETIKQLSDRGARTVVMAHQGRPARKDFTSLEKHSRILSGELGRPVRFVQSFFGPELGDGVASMDDGDVVMLENVRMLSEELQNLDPERHSHDFFVERMSRYFDLFVNDAFSAAHRSHGSMVGFMPLLDTCAGTIMQRELDGCRKVRDTIEDPVLVLGGEKPSDIIGMLEHMIERVDKVLLSGVPGELGLMIEGNDLGKKSAWIEENGFDSDRDKLEELLDKYGEKIVLPEDVRTDSGSYNIEDIPENEMTWDIGPETASSYTDIIKQADSVLMKGPAGAFDEGHENGTKALVNALASCDGFTVMGGGHTSSLVQRFGYEIDDFSHVSIAGGAFVRFMSGENLAAIKALEKYS